MNPHSISRRATSAVLLATLASASLAPAAHAGHGYGYSYKYRGGDGAYCGDRGGMHSRVVFVPERRVVFREHSAGGGGVLAGLLGGIAIGAILSNAAHSHPAPVASGPGPACPPPDRTYEPESSGYPSEPEYTPPARDDYSYEDPFCHERFSSLDLYRAHVERRGHHALVAQVIDNSDGDVIDVIRFNGGHWESCDTRDQYDRGDDDGGDDSQ